MSLQCYRYGRVMKRSGSYSIVLVVGEVNGVTDRESSRYFALYVRAVSLGALPNKHFWTQDVAHLLPTPIHL
jgi:hypothetical protein